METEPPDLRFNDCIARVCSRGVAFYGGGGGGGGGGKLYKKYNIIVRHCFRGRKPLGYSIPSAARVLHLGSETLNTVVHNDCAAPN